MKFLIGSDNKRVVVVGDFSPVKIKDGNLAPCAANDSALWGYLLDNCGYQKEMFTACEDANAPADLFPQGYTYDNGVFTRDESIPTPLVAAQSKKQTENAEGLAQWLATHPITFTDGKLYGVEETDQKEMTVNLTQYDASIACGDTTAVLKWHSKKAADTEWNRNDFVILYNQITSYVAPYKQYMSDTKAAIYASATMDELTTITIDYSSVT